MLTKTRPAGPRATVDDPAHVPDNGEAELAYARRETLPVADPGAAR